ncbi:MAG TPA: hypothetical protein DEB47_12015, partial [Citreicella sp.]|nr:hypothetical protein [Citreicella sp.]
MQAIADALYAELGAIATGLRPAGAWDAASGTFPDGAVRGSYYFVSGAGIMDAQAFAVGDWLVPLVDDASTSSFSGQWVRGDYSKVVKRVYDDVNALVTSTEASRGNSALWQTRGGLSFRESSAGDELGTEDALTAGGVRLYAINRPQIAPTYLDTTSALLNGLDVSILRGINPARHPAILDTSSADDLTGDLSEFFGNLNSDHGSASIFAP